MKVDKEWFEEQCRIEGLSDKDVFVIGEYATNADGDFLYSITHKDGSNSLDFFVAKFLKGTDDDSYYEKLGEVLDGIEENYKQDWEFLFDPRNITDQYFIEQVYKEAMCRNTRINERKRNQLRSECLHGVVIPDSKDTIHIIRLGITKYEKSEDGKSEILENQIYMPKVVMKDKGYKFIPKILKDRNFVQMQNDFRRENDISPYRLLAELDDRIMYNWRQLQLIQRKIKIDMGGYTVYTFRFSHFEIERELDAKYRSCYLCYTLTSTLDE